MLLSLQDITKTFDNGVTALTGVSLSIARGEFVSLLGPSGCGKSTVLRLIAGLAAPDHGFVRWDGETPPLGFVFQDAALMPWANVEDNVKLAPSLKREAAAEITERVTAALALVGLSGFAKSFPRQLSGGMRMRVSIARALAAKASVLLMDEPFAALDELTRERLNDELRRLWLEHGLTIIFVTHSIYESVYLSSRVLVMSARPGRIIGDVVMNAPRERTPEFRASVEYAERCRSLRALLHEGSLP